MSARRTKLQAVRPIDAPAAGDDRTLPHNHEAERSVLGAVLVHNDAFEGAARILHPHDFYRDAHQRIFRAMTQLIDHNRVVVDFVTIKEELLRVGDLDEIGGPAYIAALADGVPRATNVAYYAGIVKEKALLRGIIYAANAALTRAYAAEDTATEVLAQTDRAFLELSTRTPGRMVRLSDETSALFTDLEYRIAHRGELTGVPTGFQSIDLETIGWQAGDLIVIGARPSIGKTVFVMNSAVAAALAGRRVAVFSLEMRKKQLQYRLLSNLSQVPLSRIMGGFLATDEHEKISTALETMHALDIHVDDRSGQTFWDIRTACRRLKAEHGLDLVVVDYVQLMAGSLDRKGATRNEEVTDISRRLKVMADELNLPVLLLSQLSRAAKTRHDPRPQLSDLRESGALEQDADIVAFLHRKNHKDDGYTEFILEKQRNGPTGEVALTFQRDCSTFVDGGEPPPPTRKGKRTTPQADDPRLPVDGD